MWREALPYNPCTPPPTPTCDSHSAPELIAPHMWVRAWRRGQWVASVPNWEVHGSRGVDISREQVSAHPRPPEGLWEGCTSYRRVSAMPPVLAVKGLQVGRLKGQDLVRVRILRDRCRIGGAHDGLVGAVAHDRDVRDATGVRTELSHGPGDTGRVIHAWLVEEGANRREAEAH